MEKILPTPLVQASLERDTMLSNIGFTDNTHYSSSIIGRCQSCLCLKLRQPQKLGCRFVTSQKLSWIQNSEQPFFQKCKLGKHCSFEMVSAASAWKRQQKERSNMLLWFDNVSHALRDARSNDPWHSKTPGYQQRAFCLSTVDRSHSWFVAARRRPATLQ